ncbi:unnamed protein product [Staurois parvus]|uniref:Uncharacterized protein n=1 Tax=Staurois parvus TaxID=386267 RepID=A0ABN9B601_9NEOB|nr:unnamed protein product [Staurois parvus]
MPISASYQCSLCQCSSVPPVSAHQCNVSVPISAASLVHISEGEKSLIYNILKQKLRKNLFFQNFQFLVCLAKNKRH